jgi:site-specific recombinase XerD
MTPLRQRMLEDMQVRNLSPHTQDSYVRQVAQFARHFDRSPEELGPTEIRSYQVYLTNEKKLAPGSILIAVAALRFLYRVTLQKEWLRQQRAVLLIQLHYEKDHEKTACPLDPFSPRNVWVTPDTFRLTTAVRLDYHRLLQGRNDR